MKKDRIITGILIVILLAIAASLRLYHASSIPYTYDELSAIFRTYFSNFNDLIAHGAMIDGHPVGVQVFLYYWVHCVGYTELYVKLPFILCGIASVFYVFRTGKEWFNPTVGLVCAAYVATLEYTIMHSQEARPYAAGLFFSVAMVYHWSRIMFNPVKRYELNWFLYILFSAMCAYDHYFTLLLSGIVGFSGLVFVNKRYVLRYVTAGIMIFVLYIPHLHIFFYQLSMRGVGEWLAKPRSTFISDYLQYIFQFSPYVYAIAAGLVAWGIIYSIVKKKFPARFFFLSLAWFIIPFLTGLIYSLKVNPVLQYRVLIFSFPFLLFMLFGLLPDVKPLLKTGLITVICTANIVTLVHDRKYYQLFYQSPIQRICALTDSVTKTIGKNGMLRFIEGDTSAVSKEQYYIRRYRMDSTYLSLNDSKDKVALADYLDDHPRAYVSYGCLSGADPAYLPILLNYYPNVVKQYNFFGGNFYILSSKADKHKSPYIFSSNENFDGGVAVGWDIGANPPLADSIHFSGNHSYKMDSLHEYGPIFSYNLKDMIKIKNDFIVVTAEIYPQSRNMKDVALVAEFKKGDKQLVWTGGPVEDYIWPGETGTWIKVYHVIKMSDVYLDSPDVQVKVYLWNKGRRFFYIDNFKVSTLRGNPYLYGTEEKLQHE